MVIKKPPIESIAFNPNLIERETARVEIFSDAVFAIVITLLILDLQIPSGYALNPIGSLIAMWPKFVAYFLSFITIGVYWISHHNIFNFIKRANRKMMWLNLMFLMSVAVMPFPTKLISEYRTEPASAVTYGLVLMFINCTLYIFWIYASKNYHLVSKELPHEVIQFIRWQILSAILLCVVAIIVSYLYPAFSLLIYGIVVLRFVVPRNVRKMIKKMRFYQTLFHKDITTMM